MGFIYGSITYRRFRVEHKPPRDFKERAAQRLQRFAFKEINPKTNPEISLGWVHPFDPTDVRLTLERVLFGKYIILGFRKDRKSIPALLLKAQVNEAVRAAEKERRGKKLSRPEILSLRETVKEKMLATVTPSIALYEAVWDHEEQDLFLSAQSSKICAEFAELFQETFELTASEVNLVTRAESFIDSHGLDLALSDLDAAQFGG